MELLEEGKMYKENDLIQLIGTPAMKKRVLEDNISITGSQRTTLKNILTRTCEYKELKNHRYRITKIYEHSLPTAFKNVPGTLSQYVIPNILEQLLESPDYKCTYTLDQWAQNINMISGSFHYMKDMKGCVAKEIGTTKKYVQDLYGHVTDSIRYQFKKTFFGLDLAKCVATFPVFVLRTRVKVENERGDVQYVKCYHDANEEERAVIMEIYREVDEHFNIDSEGQRYYGFRSEEYMEEFNYLLEERLQADLCYKAYELHITNVKKCKEIIAAITERQIPLNLSQPIDNLNLGMAYKIMENSIRRYETHKKKWVIEANPLFSSVEDQKNVVADFCEQVILTPETRKEYPNHRNILTD